MIIFKIIIKKLLLKKHKIFIKHKINKTIQKKLSIRQLLKLVIVQQIMNDSLNVN